MNVEERLERSLAVQVDAFEAGAALEADRIVAAGRAARVRRRRTVIAGVAAGVAVAAIATGTLAAVRSTEGRRPYVPATPSGTVVPSPTLTAPPGAVTVSNAGLTILAGNVIRPPEGPYVTLQFPAEMEATNAIAVPSGWVVEVTEPDGVGLWFAPLTGTPRRIGGLFGNFAVSPDGQTLVASGVKGPLVVTRYELPSLRELSSLTFDSGMGPIVAGVTDDWVVLHGATGSPGPTTAAVWWPATNELRRTDREVTVWGVSEAGWVLRRVFQGPADQPPTSACVDLVPAAELEHVTETGLCSGEIAPVEMSAAVSPDGTWVALSGYGQGLRLVRVADLRVGQWRPSALTGPANGTPLFWLGPTAFVAWSDGGTLRCTVDSGCAPLLAPEQGTEWTVVTSRG